MLVNSNNTEVNSLLAAIEHKLGQIAANSASDENQDLVNEILEDIKNLYEKKIGQIF